MVSWQKLKRSRQAGEPTSRSPAFLLKRRAKKMKNRMWVFTIKPVCVVKRLLAFLCLLLLASSLFSCGEPPKVNRVIDGDTIEVKIETDIQRVRLIGINTPEIGQPYAYEATEALKDLILFKKVRLEKDISETDKYGRLLRYVYVNTKGREIFVNEEMVRNGYAQVMTIPPMECSPEQTRQRPRKYSLTFLTNSNINPGTITQMSQSPVMNQGVNSMTGLEKLLMKS